MNTEHVAQIIGVIAFLIGITTFAQRNEKRFKFQLGIFSFMLGIHFFMLGATIAGANCIINTARSIVSAYTKNVYIALVFITLVLSVAIWKAGHFIDFFPVIGTVMTTWMMFKGDGFATRCTIWCSSFLWLIHNIAVNSIGGSMIEFSFLIVNGSNIFKFYKLLKQGINPFETNK